MLSLLQLLRLEVIYPELKLNSVVLWQCPVFVMYLVQTLIKLQGSVTEVSVRLFFFPFFFLSFFFPPFSPPLLSILPCPSEYQDNMLMTNFILN